ncbi:hypothetical protein [Paracoccus fistulariae]|uniref:DUF4760 domain-containing protein n=1 Tax=Paracoccus fistulariae TaxID=658446 RepID=A0ABY7SQ93_9RHOB|nr:hypothetical protein [Paracoccus fistulariae]MDB6180095.1 hypothetical protein [Paracoccus fistulariae]WCR08182.1 hypothetical protein JHX87_05040 [Paracoccus fistulariae]
MSAFALVGALMASSAALWVAYKVYPHQKELDRQLQMRSEKREAAIEFLEAAQDFVDSNNRRAREDEILTQSRFEVAARRLALYIDGKEVDALGAVYFSAKDYAKAVKKWADAKREEKEDERRKQYTERKRQWQNFQCSRDRYIVVIRKEFFPSEEEGEKILKAFTRAQQGPDEEAQSGD